MVLITQGCSNKEDIAYVDRPKEVVKTKGCKTEPILFCQIRDVGAYTDIIDDYDRCVRELIIVINKCSLGTEIEHKAPD